MQVVFNTNIAAIHRGTQTTMQAIQQGEQGEPKYTQDSMIKPQIDIDAMDKTKEDNYADYIKAEYNFAKVTRNQFDIQQISVDALRKQAEQESNNTKTVQNPAIVEPEPIKQIDDYDEID